MVVCGRQGWRRGPGVRILDVTLALLVVGLWPRLGMAEAPSDSGSKATQAVAADEAHPPGHSAVPKQRVVVFAVQVVNLDPGVASVLTDKLTEGVAQKLDYQVISNNEIVSLIGLEAKKQLVGCSESGCMTELAGALNADLLVTAKVVRFGKKITISARIAKVEDALVLKRESMELDEESQLPESLRLMGARIAGVTNVTELETKLGVISRKRWRVSLGALGGGFGVVSKMALHSALESGNWTAQYDEAQTLFGGASLALGRTFTRWWSLDVSLSVERAAITLSDMPFERVLVVEASKEYPSPSPKNERGNGPMGEGCLLIANVGRADAIQGRDGSGLGTRIGNDGRPDNLSENTSFVAHPLATKGICSIAANRLRLALTPLMTAHLVPWLSLEVGPRLGLFSYSWDWYTVDDEDRDRQSVSGWLAGGLLALRLAPNAFYTHWPKWLSLRFGGDFIFLGSFGHSTLGGSGGDLGDIKIGKVVPSYSGVLATLAAQAIVTF